MSPFWSFALHIPLVSAAFWKFSTDQKGFFLQETLSAKPNPSDYAPTQLGLILQPYDTDKLFDPESLTPRWERFAYYIDHMNQRHGNGELIDYKVLYLQRTGEAYHNVAEKQYGKECWVCYWSRQERNRNISWIDAALTTTGIEQSERVQGFWRVAPDVERIPPPEVAFVSPMLRALQFANTTFANSSLLRDKKVFVDEGARGPISACTCARRRPMSEATKLFPTFIFDTSLPEHDTDWSAGASETQASRDSRVTMFLDWIWDRKETFVSITTHEGTIADILKIVGHPNPKFEVAPGQIIPILVRGDKVKGNGPDAVLLRNPVSQCGICGSM